jgi:hypothetical protein
MIPIRLIAAEGSDLRLLGNLANNLNQRQTEFCFWVHEKVLKFPRKASARLSTLEQLEALAKKLCAEEYPDEHPVIICNCKFNDYKFAKLSEDVTVITTGGLPEASSRDFVQKYIAFALVDTLMSFYVQVGSHLVARACVADSWNNEHEVRAGLAKCEYCSECRSLIMSAIGGEISLHQVAAIFRLLDYAADRKTCFVIMPFNKTFEKIYEIGLKPALVNQSWVCNRADKIFQSREIMTLVWEEILRSDLIIADLTGKNANVFYELGYAHALDKPTILITQSISDVPFDLRHRRLVEYSRKGLHRLAENIVKYL